MNHEIIYAVATVLISIVMAYVIHWVKTRVAQKQLGEAGYKAKTFLTPNEVDFFHRLQRATPDRFVVLPQVAMGALIDTKLKRAHPHYWDARREFSGRVCDFVVCDAKTLVPQLVIELDDKMHDFQKDQCRDTLAARAGYRTLRFWSRAKPSDADLTKILGVNLALN